MTGALCYSLTEAAERLGKPFSVDWLKGHLAEIPHLKVGKGTGRGGRVGFTEGHLAEILLMFAVEPTPKSQPGEFSSVRTRRKTA